MNVYLYKGALWCGPCIIEVLVAERKAACCTIDMLPAEALEQIVSASGFTSESDHIRTLTVRIRLINQQLKTAHCKLDELCAQLIPSEENEPGQQCEQRDVVILRSMPGLGRIILAVLALQHYRLPKLDT